MNAVKDFLLDFWRELFFGVLILSFVFLVLGYRSRGEEIARLKSETSTNQVDIVPLTEAEQNKEQEPVDTVKPEDTNQNKPVDTETKEKVETEDSYAGFNLAENQIWTFSEGNENAGYTFTNGAEKIDVITKPASVVVGSDVNWLFEVNENKNTKVNKIQLTDKNETFCVAGQANCTFGDGRLQILANESVQAGAQPGLQLFYTNEDYSLGDNSFSSFENFMKLLEVN